MKFIPLALFLSANSLLFTDAALRQNEKCPPSPEPIRDIKFFDLGGDSIHNYELHGNARIVEPAPGDVARALRIDSLYSYALLKGLDISPGVFKDLTISIGVYIESIRPAIANAPDPDQNESYGWVVSHDNGGYDRAIFLHDERFNGMGLSTGTKAPANAEYTIPPLQQWIQVIGVWRQGGECEMYIDSEKHFFSEPIKGKNNAGRSDLAVGTLQAARFAKENDNDFWIKDLKVFDYALTKEDIDAMNCNFIEELKPTIDCGDGDDLVMSCTECPDGPGAAGCAGDCFWDDDLGACIDDGPDEGISCGSHDASDCASCDLSQGQSGCSGDCKFAAGECRPIDWKPPVDCGTHQAGSCSECPGGRGASGCSGECMWDEGQCVPDTGAEVSCGDHDAADCFDCDISSGTSGCSGDCKFSEGQCRPIDWKPPVDCGGNRDEASCGDCPFGSSSGALGCQGDCMWSGGKCVPDTGGEVSCGMHDAPSCSACDISMGAPTGCSGDCKFAGGECRPIDWKPPVDCGKHEASSCSACPYGSGSALGCSGDCMWSGGKCVPDTGGGEVSCGLHDAPSCSACDLRAGTGAGCSGDCKFADGQCRPIDWKPPVDCGNNREEASCGDCPFGSASGALGCAGDCMWNASLGKCVPDTGTEVSCGMHDASSCSACDISMGAAAGCSGQCKFAAGQCRPIDWKPPVDCGKHEASSCSACPYGSGSALGCSGDCMWSGGKCVPDTGGGEVSCGLHDAPSCSACDLRSGTGAGCSGDCKFADGQCRPIDWKPPIDCGDHQATSCGACPFGNGAAGCAGDCMWNVSLGKCVPDSGNEVSCGKHDAPSCSACDISGGTSGCSGQCKFAAGQCRPIDWKPPMVDCGDHEASTCSSCVYHTGERYETVGHGCQGECMWNHATRTCIKDNGNDLSCGDHDAASCDKCPTKLGAVGCGGDCQWNPFTKKCENGKPSNVLCGSHNALVCGNCANGEEGCQGDCKWDHASDKCVSKDYQPPMVDCGDHEALDCSKCVYHTEGVNYQTIGHGCQGECFWKHDSATWTGVCLPKNGPTVDCGDHNVRNNCFRCPTKDGAVGCAGQCMWDPRKKKCVPKSGRSILCGSHRADVCGDCANEQKGCNNDCRWSRGKCIKS